MQLRHVPLTVVIVLVLGLGSLIGGGAGTPDKPDGAIAKVLENQVAAWNKKDLEGFMTGYWKSPDLSFFAGNNKTKGWQATLDRYRKRYQADGKEMGQLKFTELTIEMLGTDHALVRGRYQLTMKEKSPTGLFTLIFRKQDAAWKIIHDHTSD